MVNTVCSPDVTRWSSSTFLSRRGSLIPGKVTATPSQLPVGRVKVTVLSLELIGSRLGLSSDTDGAFKISKESRETFFRPCGEFGSTFKVRT